MGNRWAIGLVVLWALACGHAHASANPCGSTVEDPIPARAPTAVTGSEFVRRLNGLSDDERETAIRRELMAGNIPGFLRRLRPVTLIARDRDGADMRLTACVSPDYLAIGSDSDYLLMPMRLETALAVASRYGFTLPTRKLVDAIYSQATIHLAPQPLPASDAMRSTDYYWNHDRIIHRQREMLGATVAEGALVSGHKKDLILTNRLWNHLERVAIYGWHRPDGRPVQPLSTVHGWRYADYSHGVRLVSTTALVNGRPQSLYSVLEHPRLSSLLSDEGTIPKALTLVEVLMQHKPAAIAASVPSQPPAGARVTLSD